LCHQIHNIYKSTIIHDDELNSFSTMLDQFSLHLRVQWKTFGTLCPKHIPSSYIIDYDILSFINEKQEIIQ
jgi:hypothetical protein